VPDLHLVDAFTDVAFAGNPAGVVLLEDSTVDEVWAQQVAAEVGASETAFLWPRPPAVQGAAPHGASGGDLPPHDPAGSRSNWGLRWWTPTTEVDLCGHATLAAAHVLRSRGLVAHGHAVSFTTRSGVLRAVGGTDGRLWLDLPAWPVADHPAPGDVDGLLGGVAGRYLGRTRVDQANDVIEVADTTALDAVVVDPARVTALEGTGLIVCCDGEDTDAAMRYFAPAVGVAEDPVTGSAACTVAPLWAARLGRGDVTIAQRSARGGRLWTRVGPVEEGSGARPSGAPAATLGAASGAPAADRGRVAVGGHAVTTITGEIVGP